MPLSLRKQQALDVIHFSESQPGPNGGHEGHTKTEHVNASRDRLTERMEAPGKYGRKDKVHWRSAFIGINECAEMLVKTISQLGSDPFVRDFHKLDDGKHFDQNDIFVGEFHCRDHRGTAYARHVHLVMMKHEERPHKLHLVTFYPVLPLLADD